MNLETFKNIQEKYDLKLKMFKKKIAFYENTLKKLK